MYMYSDAIVAYCLFLRWAQLKIKLNSGKMTDMKVANDKGRKGDDALKLPRGQKPSQLAVTQKSLNNKMKYVMKPSL